MQRRSLPPPHTPNSESSSWSSQGRLRPGTAKGSRRRFQLCGIEPSRPGRRVPHRRAVSGKAAIPHNWGEIVAVCPHLNTLSTAHPKPSWVREHLPPSVTQTSNLHARVAALCPRFYASAREWLAVPTWEGLRWRDPLQALGPPAGGRTVCRLGAGRTKRLIGCGRSLGAGTRYSLSERSAPLRPKPASMSNAATGTAFCASRRTTARANTPKPRLAVMRPMTLMPTGWYLEEGSDIGCKR